MLVSTEGKHDFSSLLVLINAVVFNYSNFLDNFPEILICFDALKIYLAELVLILYSTFVTS